MVLVYIYVFFQWMHINISNRKSSIVIWVYGYNQCLHDLSQDVEQNQHSGCNKWSKNPSESSVCSTCFSEVCLTSSLDLCIVFCFNHCWIFRLFFYVVLFIFRLRLRFDIYFSIFLLILGVLNIPMISHTSL